MRENEMQKKSFESARGDLQTKIRQLQLSSRILKEELTASRKRLRLEADPLSNITEMMRKLKI